MELGCCFNTSLIHLTPRGTQLNVTEQTGPSLLAVKYHNFFLNNEFSIHIKARIPSSHMEETVLPTKEPTHYSLIDPTSGTIVLFYLEYSEQSSLCDFYFDVSAIE